MTFSISILISELSVLLTGKEQIIDSNLCIKFWYYFSFSSKVPVVYFAQTHMTSLLFSSLLVRMTVRQEDLRGRQGHTPRGPNSFILMQFLAKQIG